MIVGFSRKLHQQIFILLLFVFIFKSTFNGILINLCIWRSRRNPKNTKILFLYFNLEKKNSYKAKKCG